MDWSIVLLIIYAAGFFLLAGWFVAASVREKEYRAVKVGAVFLVAALVILALVVILAYNKTFDTWLIGTRVLDVIMTLALAALLWPTGRDPAVLKGSEYYCQEDVKKVDERDIIFARIRSLRPGHPEYEHYYEKMHPERKERDDARRAMGGPLGVPGTIDRHNRPNIGYLQGMFNFPLLIGKKEIVYPTPAGEPVEISPQELTKRVKGFARHLGADLVGVTRINPLWVYSHRGEILYNNWEEWGREIKNDHEFAVVIATEMDRDMIMTRPHTPATVESTKNYSEGAFITVQLATFLAGLGFRAAAHHLRHYEVMCVPLAVDAGLGELGRNGYLITKEFGPRVRLAVVTTNAPLIPDKPVDLGIQNFCALCKKCAETCPSKSIPAGEKAISNGSLRWVTDVDSCSAWWARLGTDCCICMAVCPWSHPNTRLHKITRFLATRSVLARRLLISADDLFYGNYKGPWYGPDWCDYRWPNSSSGSGS